MSNKNQKSKIIKISSRKTRDYWEIPILFENEEVMVIDKPSGLHVRADDLEPNLPALNLLLVDHIERGVAWTKEMGVTFLRPTHDLDAEASGVLIIGKSEEACRKIHNQFYSHDYLIDYLLIIQGAPVEEEFSVDAKLAMHGKRPGVYCVSKTRGKKAVSRYKVEEHFVGYSVLAAQCNPNRLHQARVHLRYLGPCLVGDHLYNGVPLKLSRIKPKYRLKRNKTERPLLNRAAIHARKVTFKCPGSGEDITVESPLPKDIEVSLKYLRMYADPAGYYDDGPGSGNYSLDDYSVDT